jgi:hypothetical protein
MNICIFGKRKIKVIATGEEDEQYISFMCWQTPTKVSYAIEQSPDFIQAYIDWVIGERSQDQEMDLYFYETEEYKQNPDAYTDLDKLYEIVGTKTVNIGRAHVEAFQRWVEESRAKGYEIYCEVI